jgi:Mg-chelatase subunit ChlD
LTIDVQPDRTQGTVRVSVEADLGGFLFAGRLPFLSGVEAIGSMKAVSGVESANAPVAVVLAIDTSNSMQDTLDGRRASTTDSRMQIVQRAADDMVRILGPNARDPVAIGVVPWSHTACVDQIECDRNNGQVALPPSTDPITVSHAINSLVADGLGTRSTFGLTVGKDFLDKAPNKQRKVLVLLTDGEDNLCLRPDGRRRNCSPQAARLDQAAACTAAKDAGIEIFVVAAMEPTLVSGPHGDALRDCSSDGDSPGEHVFLNNVAAENLQTAFAHIANQLVMMRRVY